MADTFEEAGVRRRVLRGLGAFGAISLAGCAGLLGGEGIHRHVDLTIELQGEPQEIPADIGIGDEHADNPYYDSGMEMTSIHTHDDSGTIHWEIEDREPKPGELQLGAFFDIWGKRFTETCIFDACNGDDGTVTMLVDGTPNEAFAEYRVDDGDEIVIKYE